MIRLPTHRAPTHPGEILREDYLEPLALSQSDLARHLRIPVNRVNEIVTGKRGISANTALRLEKGFGTSAVFWLNLQQAYELWHEQQSAEWQIIRRIKRVPTARAGTVESRRSGTSEAGALVGRAAEGASQPWITSGQRHARKVLGTTRRVAAKRSRSPRH
jgi:antitoxin HigA-1